MELDKLVSLSLLVKNFTSYCRGYQIPKFIENLLCRLYSVRLDTHAMSNNSTFLANV